MPAKKRAPRRQAKPKHGPVRSALEVSMQALATALEHEALQESCRRLADAIDGADVFDEALWREWRLSLKALMEATAVGDSDSFEAELDRLRAEVGDTADS